MTQAFSHRYLAAAVILLAGSTGARAADLVYNYNGTNYTFIDYTYMGVPGRLYVPPGYNPNTPTPLVMFLHGIGEQINNANESLATNLNTGQINGNMTNLMLNARTQNFLLFAPQSAYEAWWAESDTTVKAVAKLTTQYNIDPNRIYVTGLSAGGGGTMGMLANYSNVFAAYVPLSIAGGGFSTAAAAAPAVGRPTWYFVGCQDGFMGPTRTSVNSTLQAQFGPSAPLPAYPESVNYTWSSSDNKLRYTQYGSAGHDNGVWNNGAYNDPTMYSWMLGQSNSLGTLATGKSIMVSLKPWQSFAIPLGLADTAGRRWNADPWQSTLAVFQPFAKDSTGKTTTVTMEQTKAFYSNMTTTLPANAPYDTSVAGNCWTVNQWTVGEIVIHGLTAGTHYNLDLFASIATTAGSTAYIGQYMVAGQSVTINGANNANLVSLNGLVASPTGDLTLDVSTVAGSSNAVLNTLSLTAVPEPASLVLMIGVAGLMGLRRRRRAVE